MIDSLFRLLEPRAHVSLFCARCVYSTHLLYSKRAHHIHFEKQNCSGYYCIVCLRGLRSVVVSSVRLQPRSVKGVRPGCIRQKKEEEKEPSARKTTPVYFVSRSSRGSFCCDFRKHILVANVGKVIQGALSLFVVSKYCKLLQLISYLYSSIWYKIKQKQPILAPA